MVTSAAQQRAAFMRKVKKLKAMKKRITAQKRRHNVSRANVANPKKGTPGVWTPLVTGKNIPVTGKSYGPKTPAIIAARASLAAKRKKQAAAKAAAKQARVFGAGKSRSRRAVHSPMPSSWVDGIGYDAKTGILTAILSNFEYKWEGVTSSMYYGWIAGNYACKTNDPTGRHRWYITKRPSLGATFHRYFKPMLDASGCGRIY